MYLGTHLLCIVGASRRKSYEPDDFIPPISDLDWIEVLHKIQQLLPERFAWGEGIGDTVHSFQLARWAADVGKENVEVGKCVDRGV